MRLVSLKNKLKKKKKSRCKKQVQNEGSYATKTQVNSVTLRKNVLI